MAEDNDKVGRDESAAILNERKAKEVRVTREENYEVSILYLKTSLIPPKLVLKTQLKL